MKNMASWNGHKFQCSAKQIYSFTNLTLKVSSETEDKDKKKQKYVQRKNAKPYEITMTIILDRRFGISAPKKEALKICEEARAGNEDYFYFAGTKVVDCKFMLVEATVEKVEMLSNGKWIMCEVKCTWKQSTTIAGASSGSGSGSPSKKSGKSSRSSRSKRSKPSGLLKIAGVQNNSNSGADSGIDAISSAAPKISTSRTSSNANSKASTYIKTTRAAANSSTKTNTTQRTTIKNPIGTRRRSGS